MNCLSFVNLSARYIFLSRLGQSLVVGLKGALPALSKPEVELWGRVAKWPMKGAFKLVELLFAAQFKNMVGPTSPLFKKCVVADFYGYAHVKIKCLNSVHRRAGSHCTLLLHSVTLLSNFHSQLYLYLHI